MGGLLRGCGMSRESSILILRVEGEEGRSGERSGERRGVVVVVVVVVRWLFFCSFAVSSQFVGRWSNGARVVDAARTRRGAVVGGPVEGVAGDVEVLEGGDGEHTEVGVGGELV